MVETTLTGTAPLTRRQAREIERRTGVRPVASFAPSAAPKDTGEIERNEMDALVSVLPTELIDRVAAPIAADEVEIPEAFDARSLSVRAARPAVLVAQRRRRVAGGFAAAASVTALATAALTTVGGQGVNVAADEHQANLLTATAKDSSDIPADAVEEAAEVAAPAPIEVDADSTSIVSFDAAVVQAAATEAVVETPAEESTDSESGASSSSSSSSSSGSTSVSSASYEPSAPGATIAATAESWVGQGMYGHGTTPSAWDCSGFVLYVYAQHGISLPWGVNSQAAMGTVVSDPQPGDLVVFGSGYHVGIYVGGGQMVHSPDWGRSIEYGSMDWDSHYFVRI